MQAFRRRHHRLIGRILKNLDGAFLRRARCYFGGGTQSVLAFGEYRESRDIDFLCADRDGYRMLRETVTSDSLGKIVRRSIPLAREVRGDRDGIRTFFSVNNTHIKFEIVREARIELSGRMDAELGVPVLSRECAIAEKFLANVDRGLDRVTHMRDLIDLAYLATHSSSKALLNGYQRATKSYGTSVSRHLGLTLAGFDRNDLALKDCFASLGISRTKGLADGISKLKRLLRERDNPVL